MRWRIPLTSTVSYPIEVVHSTGYDLTTGTNYIMKLDN